MEKSLETRQVTALHLGKAGDGFSSAEEQAEHAADLVGDKGDTRRLRAFAQTRQQFCGAAFQPVVETRLLHQVKGRQSGGHGDRVAGQCAGLIHRAGGCDFLHDVFPATESTDRQTTTDHFAERGEVGGDAVVLLGTTRRETETGHHFVKYQHAAGLVTDLAQRFQKSGYGRNAVHVAGHRFDDDGGNLLAEFCKRVSQLVDIVVFERDCVSCNIGRHPG